jgi:anti-anti-sigma factor
MKPGQILVADYQGVYVIKMLGDVRLTFCISFDQFIDAMFSDSKFSSVVFDLSNAEAIDSTTLGLMAKISILSQEHFQVTPIVLATSPSIQRILQTMGFADIFTIVDKLDSPHLAERELHCGNCDEVAVKERVLEAHKILMNMNEKNAAAFRDLVNMLQSN